MPAAASYVLDHGGHRVEVTVKEIKGLRLRVKAEGKLLASVPPTVSPSQVRAFLDANSNWIREAQQRVRMAASPVEPLANGGRVLLWGRWHEVRLAGGARAGARLDGPIVLVSGVDEEARRRGLDALYRRELAAVLPDLQALWESRLGKQASIIKLRRMTSRWGTCNTRSGAITLNLALAEREPRALEYVLVHELAHLHEPGHGPRFRAWMDAMLPDWSDRQQQLKVAI